MMLALLYALPKWSKWAVLGIALFAISGLYLSHRNAIYQDGYRTALEDQRRANEATIKRATDRLMREANELAKTRTEFEDALKQLDEASNADPDGGNIAIGPDSVRRLNEAVGYGSGLTP